MKTTFLKAAMALLALAAAALQAHAQDYPQRPVTIVVPFGAGGATDLSARTVAQLLAKQLGQSFVVENKVGASGMIGMGTVARAAPDGYTLGWGGNSPMTVAPHLSKTPLYDPSRAFTPVSVAAISSWVVITRADMPVRTMQDLVAAAKAQPGKLTFASSGIGSAPHLLGEVFKSAAGIDILHVPFKGEVDGFTALLGGQVDFMFGSTSTSTQMINAGKLKGLAVTTPQRDRAVPNIPTVTEANLPDLTFEIFFGLLAPAGTPPPVIAKLAAAMKQAVQDPVYRESMEKVGIQAVSSTSAEFAALLKRHNDRWQALIARNRIVIE